MVIFYIIIMVLSYFFGKYNYMDKNISGFYETNNDFNIESGIKSMTFYIKSKIFLRYSGYILMISNTGDIVINEPVNFTLKPCFNKMTKDLLKNNCCVSNDSNTQTKFTFILKFKNIETTLIPPVLNIEYYPSTHKIILYDKDKLYAFMYKNPIISELDKNDKQEKKIDHEYL